jgi:phosphatidylserine decarboxylase
VLAHRRSKVVREAWPILIFVSLVAFLLYRYVGPLWGAPFVLLDIVLYFLYRDPWRDVPSEPLGAVAPVDGEVIAVETDTADILAGDWIRIAIRVSRMGAYTVRSPIEGVIRGVGEHTAANTANRPRGMWLRSEEQHDVMLMFPGRYAGLGPKSFARYGERVGQGERFAYLRLAPRAEVILPGAAHLRIAKGDRVLAGQTIIADLPEPEEAEVG